MEEVPDAEETLPKADGHPSDPAVESVDDLPVNGAMQQADEQLLKENPSTVDSGPAGPEVPIVGGNGNTPQAPTPELPAGPGVLLTSEESSASPVLDPEQASEVVIPALTESGHGPCAVSIESSAANSLVKNNSAPQDQAEEKPLELEVCGVVEEAKPDGRALEESGQLPLELEVCGVVEEAKLDGRALEESGQLPLELEVCGVVEEAKPDGRALEESGQLRVQASVSDSTKEDGGSVVSHVAEATKGAVIAPKLASAPSSNSQTEKDARIIQKRREEEYRLADMERKLRSQNFRPSSLPPDIRSFYDKLSPGEMSLFRRAYGFNSPLKNVVDTVESTKKCLKMLSEADRNAMTQSSNKGKLPVKLEFLHLAFEPRSYLTPKDAEAYEKLGSSKQGQFRKLYFLGVPIPEILTLIESVPSYREKLLSRGLDFRLKGYDPRLECLQDNSAPQKPAEEKPQKQELCVEEAKPCCQVLKEGDQLLAQVSVSDPSDSTLMHGGFSVPQGAVANAGVASDAQMAQEQAAKAEALRVSLEYRQRSKTFSPNTFPPEIRTSYDALRPKEKNLFRLLYRLGNPLKNVLNVVERTRKSLKILSEGGETPIPLLLDQADSPVPFHYLHVAFEPQAYLPPGYVEAYEKLNSRKQGMFRKLFFLRVPLQEIILATESTISFKKKLNSIGLKPGDPAYKLHYNSDVNGIPKTLKPPKGMRDELAHYYDLFDPQNELSPEYLHIYQNLSKSLKNRFKALYYFKVPLEKIVASIRDHTTYQLILHSLESSRKKPEELSAALVPGGSKEVSRRKRSTRKKDPAYKGRTFSGDEVPAVYHERFNPHSMLPGEFVSIYLGLDELKQKWFRALFYHEVPVAEITKHIKTRTEFWRKLNFTILKLDCPTESSEYISKPGRVFDPLHASPRVALQYSKFNKGAKEKYCRMYSLGYSHFDIIKGISDLETYKAMVRKAKLQHSALPTTKVAKDQFKLAPTKYQQKYQENFKSQAWANCTGPSAMVDSTFMETFEQTQYPIPPMSVSNTALKRPVNPSYQVDSPPSKMPKRNTAHPNEELDKWDKSKIVYVSHAQHPRELLTVTEMSSVQESILDAIMEIKEDQPKPSFFHSYTNRFRGQLVFYCNDDTTVHWLRTFIPYCKPWQGACLKTTVDSIDTRCKALAILPKCSEDDDEKILHYIGRQNTNFNISEWSILKRSSDPSGTVMMNLLVDLKSANVLSENPRINFKLGRANITVKMRDGGMNDKSWNKGDVQAQAGPIREAGFSQDIGSCSGFISFAQQDSFPLKNQLLPSQPMWQGPHQEPPLYGEAPKSWTGTERTQHEVNLNQHSFPPSAVHTDQKKPYSYDDVMTGIGRHSEPQFNPSSVLSRTSYSEQQNRAEAFRLSHSLSRGLRGDLRPIQEHVSRPLLLPQQISHSPLPLRSPRMPSPPLPPRSRLAEEPRSSVFQRLADPLTPGRKRRFGECHSKWNEQQSADLRGDPQPLSKMGRERSPVRRGDLLWSRSTDEQSFPRSHAPPQSRWVRERSPSPRSDTHLRSRWDYKQPLNHHSESNLDHVLTPHYDPSYMESGSSSSQVPMKSLHPPQLGPGPSTSHVPPREMYPPQPGTVVARSFLGQNPQDGRQRLPNYTREKYGPGSMLQEIQSKFYSSQEHLPKPDESAPRRNFSGAARKRYNYFLDCGVPQEAARTLAVKPFSRQLSGNLPPSVLKEKYDMMSLGERSEYIELLGDGLTPEEAMVSIEQGLRASSRHQN